MVTVAKFRDYLNPAPDISEEQLELWLKAAQSEARSAGVPAYKHNAQYDLFIYALGTWYYDNRGMQVSGTYQATALETKKKITDSFVLQLRFAGEDPDPEPEEPAGEDQNQNVGGDGE